VRFLRGGGKNGKVVRSAQSGRKRTNHEKKGREDRVENTREALIRYEEQEKNECFSGTRIGRVLAMRRNPGRRCPSRPRRKKIRNTSIVGVFLCKCVGVKIEGRLPPNPGGASWRTGRLRPGVRLNRKELQSSTFEKTNGIRLVKRKKKEGNNHLRGGERCLLALGWNIKI